MPLNFSPAIELLYAAENILITSHSNPDGDAIGSCLALYGLVQSLYKKATILINGSACPTQYKFLKNSSKVKMYDVQLHSQAINSADAIFMLDFNDISRINLLGEIIMGSPAKKIVIDHHTAPKISTDIVLSDSTACATGQLIFQLFQQGHFALTKDIADAIYTAILTDSGCFRFASTTAEVHRITATLIECGVKPDEIYENIYNTISLERLRLQSLAVEKIKIFKNGKLCLQHISTDDFENSGATPADTENLSQIGLSIKGVIVSISVVSDYEQQMYRFSLRSKGNVDVSCVAAKFGGGGHFNASGFKIPIREEIEHYIKLVVNEFKV